MASFVIVDLEKGKLPTRATKASAGYDIYSPIHKSLASGETAVIKTGVSIKLPDNYVFILKSRSGLALKGITTEGGVIDADYFPNEIGVILRNSSKTPFIINPGDRISQGIIFKYETVKSEIATTSVRTGGFGSTN